MNTVIFDFDGTIADSFEHVLVFLLSQTGRTLSSITPEERVNLKGLSMKDLALRLGVPRWRLPIVYFVGKAKLTKRMRHIPLFTGMREVLVQLHADDFQLYIVSSNSKRNINRFLIEQGLSSYFIKVYGSAGWFGKGPILKTTLERHNLQASNSVYVGDEVRDVVGAHVAGMAAVAVNWGFGAEQQLLDHKPTVLVRSPAELAKTLLDWGK